MEEKTVLFVEQIDHIANNFEQHWTEHFIERLDHLIADVPEELKAAARQELFRVDFEIHFKKGKRVHTGDYIKCFPHYESDIQKAYQCLMSTRRLGEYEYYELLGRGGMGNVYRGTHRLLGRTVAIKLLNSKIFDIAGGTERFLREIRLAGQQQHPNIVSTEYAGKSGDRYYLVMEFIEGGSVATAIYRNGPVSIPVACEILRQTAQGLQYIFENGFVHRDIKPGNLMISRGGVIKIIDFGLGKFTASKFEDDHALTTVGTTMGSIDYVAPEQLTHAALATIQADIYSLGCVFFHLLTGRAPLESEPMSRDQKLIAHIKGELPPLSRFLKNCPEEIERLYQKMVACDPKDRFAHPSEIVNIAAALASPDDLQELFGSGSFAREHSVMMLNRQESITSHSSQAWKWYIAVTLPLLLLAGYGGYHYYQSAVTETAKENVEILAPAEELPEHVIAVVVQDERAEILQFPGYSGRWWFEETPYLLPIIREKLILDDTEPRRLASEIDSSLLPSLLSESEALRPLLAFLVREIETSRSNVTDLEMLTDDYYIETTAMDDVPASVLHTLAVLWHRLSMLRGAPELERRALSHYANAITLYENENTETSRFLAKLCRFDLARLNYTIERNADRFRQELEGIIVDDTDDLTFRVHLQVVPALEQMKLGGNQEAIIEEALQLLKTSGGEDAPHPMLMALHALYADALSRKWKLQLADREWQAVERLAIQIALNTGSSDREARVSENAVMAKLARASLALYHGDLDTARYRYRDLIISIQDTLSSISPSEHARLTRQLARAWEGLADTTLFTPAHFGENLVPNASFFISDAESAYQRARDMNNDPVGNFVLQCKLALLRFSAGLIDENDRVWDNIRTSYWRLHSWNTDFERAREYFRLTEAVLGSPENALPLRSYLERSRLNVNPYNRYAGERLRIQLFAIWKLLSSELDHDVSGVQQDIVQFLDPILLRHLVQESGMRPFLLPFYDLAVRSPKKDDLVQVATRIWTARFQHHVDRTAGLHVVFYFPLGDVEGFALLLTTDSRENQRFGLGVTRQQVLEAARNGETLSLPSELTEIIQMAREMSEAIDISWDDSICWTSTMERFRLTPERWAFDIELNPQRLPSVARE